MAIINKLKAILKSNFERKSVLRQAQRTEKNRCSWIVISWLSVYTFVMN